MAINDRSIFDHKGQTLAEWFDIEQMSTAGADGVDLKQGDLPLFTGHVVLATGLGDQVLQHGFPINSFADAVKLRDLLGQKKLSDQIDAFQSRACDTRLGYLMYIFASQRPPVILRIKPKTLHFLNNDFFWNYLNFQ
ncbi:MAG: hypothetical protein ABSE69_20345 [Roseiarcus sp.]